MAAPATALPAVATQLCDYCHQKPKHGGHAYCSKTCAAQIATLCNQCHQKPKYQNFDYCGKNCAAAATKAGTGNATGNRPTKKAAPNATPFGTTSIGGVTIDPLQIAKLVAQHIPQVQNLMTAVGPVIGQAQPQSVPPVASAAPPRAAPAPKNNPFVNNGASLAPKPAAAPVILPAASSLSTPSAPNGAPLAVPDCLIPGCGQPVHVDVASGSISAYCSKKHREEAVTQGLVEPCIMCLALPQSDTDYFCGRECREEALNKNIQTPQ
ncbi:hypothetical protein MIND_00285400 [Mycena indigotica]|uniref:Uncharacterized protein n=1 Tax=Mycena indigotica TaxID=2126181 RepID=A0A8H6WCD4_9AGAR|nr:uncharacterized protein MIND_00285400 [Mycena indigotica]KAF7312707.1 hypothetical protein MIND_00285400 [Mycena indigotica]